MNKNKRNWVLNNTGTTKKAKVCERWLAGTRQQQQNYSIKAGR